MDDSTLRVGRIASSHTSNALLALGLALGVLTYQLTVEALDSRGWTVPIAVVSCCGAIAVRNRRPLAAAGGAAAGLLLVRAFGQTHALTGAVNLLIVAPPLVCYALGTDTGVAAGLTGATLLSVGLQMAGGPFNPLFEMITFGPWLAGRVVRSRQELTRQIEIRNREIEAERLRFARESVRYERGRIARELHDIVAHCISVVVVQATVAQRLAVAAPDQAAVAVDAIAEAAREARTELGQLGSQLGTGRSAGLQRIDELARRAAAMGLTVSYRPDGDLHKLDRPASEAAYRVIQESLTNALKHAPGAPIDISLRATNHHVDIEVTSAATRAGPSGLERAGGGHGLSGMHHRVAACGGTLTAGPTAAGGWRVAARLPENNHHPIDATPALDDEVTT